MLLPLDAIAIGANARARWEEQDRELQALMSSLRDRGQLEPVLVRPLPAHRRRQAGQDEDARSSKLALRQPGSSTLALRQPRFELLAGFRRYRAAQLLGWKQIRAVVIQASERERLAIQLAENVVRKALTDIDLIRALRQLAEEHGWQVRQIARATGIAPGWVSSNLLVGRTREVYELLEAGKINLMAAIKLARLRKQDQALYQEWLERARQGIDPSQLRRIPELPSGIGRKRKQSPGASDVTDARTDAGMAETTATGASAPAGQALVQAKDQLAPGALPTTPPVSSPAIPPAIPPVSPPVSPLASLPGAPLASSAPAPTGTSGTASVPAWVETLRLSRVELGQIHMMRMMVHNVTRAIYHQQQVQRALLLPPEARREVELAFEELDRLLQTSRRGARASAD